MDRLTLATLGLGIALAWASLFACAFVLRVPFARGGKRDAALASPSYLLGHRWQAVWHPPWSEASPVRAAVNWVRPWLGSSAWPASPLGRVFAGVALLWALLVAISFVRAVVGHARLLRVCGRATEAPASVRARAALVAQRLEMVLPDVMVSDETDVPFAMGVLSPRIVLPRKELVTLSDEQLDFVLHHELVHIERGDLRVALLVGLAQLAFTGHPMQRGFLSEIAWSREASVDARVAADKPLQYASFLLELAQRMSMGRPMEGTLRMADSTLSRRIALLLSSSRTTHAPTRTQRRAAALLAASGAGLAVSVCLAPASWAAAPSAPAAVEALAAAAPDQPSPPTERAIPTAHTCDGAGGPK